METTVDSPEALDGVQFAAQMQHVLAEHPDGQRAVYRRAEILNEHGIDAAAVLPEASPNADTLLLLNETDWRDIHEAPEPFVVLWSRANRRAIEDRAAARYGDPFALEFGPAPPSPAEEHAHMAADAFLRAMPLLHGTTVETLSKVRAHGKFLSNRAVLEPLGGYQDEFGPNAGHTYEDDRELGLDDYVFVDFGRPRGDRLGEAQPEVIVVLRPEAMQRPGTIITERDYMDAERFTGNPDPWQYVRGMTVPEDFYATAATAASFKRTRFGKNVNGVFIEDPLTLHSLARGEDADRDQYGRPQFSTWEVKIKREAPFEAVDRLIFRNEAARDTYVAQNGESDTICYIVEPDIKAAMARGEDIFGTGERARADLERREAQDYARRSEAVAATDSLERQVEYIRVGADTGLRYNPDWNTNQAFASPDEIVQRERTAHDLSNTFLGMFAEEPDEYEPAPPEPVHIARVVRAGDNAIIEEITQY